MTKVIQNLDPEFTDGSSSTLDTKDVDGTGAVPAIPTVLAVSTLSASSLRGTWVDNSDNETGFEVWTSDAENGTYTLAGTTLAGVTTFDETGLGITETRWWEVLATNGAGDSDFSNKDSAVTGGVAAPGTPTNFLVVDNEDGTADISWDLADELNTESEVQIWVNGTASWDTFVDLDSTPTVEVVDNVTTPGASGAVVNGSNEFGFRLMVSNDTGGSFSAEFWVPVTDTGATVTAGTMTLTVADSTTLNSKFNTLPTNYTGVQLQSVLTADEGDEGSWADVAGADTIGELTGAGWDDTVTTGVQYSNRIKVTDGVDTVYTPVQRATAAAAGSAFVVANPDYDGGTLGNVVAGYSQTVYSDDRAETGTQSAKATIDNGTSGSSDFGLRYVASTSIGQGEGVWLRTKMYFPTGFDFTTNFGLKTLRHRMRTSGGGHLGYVDLYVKTNRQMFAQSEIQVGTVPNGDEREDFNDQVDRPDLNNSITLPLNQWVTIEQYVELNSTAGIHRIWIDGVLAYEKTTWFTIPNSSDIWNDILIFTYWNGNSPQTQSCYIDEVVVACTVDQGNGSISLVKDSENNDMIGT